MHEGHPISSVNDGVSDSKLADCTKKKCPIFSVDWITWQLPLIVAM